MKDEVLEEGRKRNDSSHSHQSTIYKITPHAFLRKKFVRGLFTNKFIF